MLLQDTITVNQLGLILESQNYRFAKTMPQWPHSYCVDYMWQSKEITIQDACKLLHKYGSKSYWPNGPRGEKKFWIFNEWDYGNVRYYFEFNNYKYFNCWVADTKEQPLNLINRAKICPM